MPKPIQNPRVGQALAREFGLVGRVHPSLDEVVVPVVIAGDVRSVVAPVRREATAFNSVAPAAGEFSFLRFEVPAATLARIKALNLRLSAAASVAFHWGSSLAAPTTAQTGLSFTDGRIRETGALPAGRFFTESVVAPLAAADRQWFASMDAQQSLPVFLPENTIGRPAVEDFLEITVLTADVTVSAAIYWEEFPFQSSRFV